MKTSLQALLAATVLFAITVATSHAATVTKIARGYSHSLFLKSDGSLWDMGYNAVGGLGDGTSNNTNRPEMIVSNNVIAISGGNYHTLFIKSDGSLWAMGDNFYGDLGDGTYNQTNRPEMIVSSNVTAVAAGITYSLFLKSDGSLWGMGKNDYGQLGDGTYNQTNRPEMIVSSNVTAIAAGTQHSLFIKTDGSLWAMGYNRWGQLGDGTFSTNAPNYGTNLPEQIVASNVTAIAAGFAHSLFIKKDGSLWAMGENDSGQLGDGIYNTVSPFGTNQPQQIVASNVTAIAGGSAHSMFLKSDGSLWVMGANGSGQLGDGTFNNTNRPEQILTSGVTAITAGQHHNLFLKSDGSLWAMGWNLYGQLGDGSNSDTNKPELIAAGPMNIAGISLTTANLVLNGIYGVSGTTNYVLISTNIALPKNQWIPVATNILNTNGNFTLTLTNAVNPSVPRQFYILQSQ